MNKYEQSPKQDQTHGDIDPFPESTYSLVAARTSSTNLCITFNSTLCDSRKPLRAGIQWFDSPLKSLIFPQIRELHAAAATPPVRCKSVSVSIMSDEQIRHVSGFDWMDVSWRSFGVQRFGGIHVSLTQTTAFKWLVARDWRRRKGSDPSITRGRSWCDDQLRILDKEKL